MIKQLSLAGTILACACASAQAAPLDLSSWTPLTLTLGGQPAGNWVLDSGNTGVTQIINADPSFYLNNLNQTSYSIDGSWQVNTSSDDDFMGFVFGYQNARNFYMFDWKQLSQNSYGGSATAGMAIKKYNGGSTDLTLGEFWQNNADLGNMTVLATNQGPGLGWADFQLYNFHLDFNQTPGDIHIAVDDGSTTLWDVSLNDTSFTAGQFGFYNFSQENVHYAGFVQSGGVIVDQVPEPAALGLFAVGLLGLGALRRRRFKV